MSRRANHGGVSSPGSHMRDAIQSRNSIPMPSGSITSPVAPLEPFNLTQAMIDGLCAVFGFFFFAALFGSLPLAVGLMFFAYLN